MTKQWIVYILASIGLLFAALWAWRKLNSKEAPPYPNDNTVVRVDIDDPGMEEVHFDSSKPLWDASFLDKVPLGRSLTTTYAKKQ